MTQKDYYQAPQANEQVDSKKVSVLIVIVAVVLTAIGVILGFLSGVSRGIGEGGRSGELIGQSIGVIVLALVIVAAFQLFKRFRNQRSRWKIYCWAIAYGALISAIKLIQAVAPLASGKALEDFELSGYYCHEVTVASITTCSCFNFKESAVLESYYGRTSSDGTKSSVIEGTYELVDKNINTSLTNSEGTSLTEVLKLTTLKHIKTSDGLVFKKMNEQPELCFVRED